MEGLVSRGINPIGANCKRQETTFQHTYRSSGIGRVSIRSVGLINEFRSLNLVACASIQSAEASKMGRFDNTLPSKEVLEIWRSADAVCFDLDSTVCTDEGIDELAEFCGAGKAVAEWTARAMSGSVPFEEALAARLSL